MDNKTGEISQIFDSGTRFINLLKQLRQIIDTRTEPNNNIPILIYRDMNYSKIKLHYKKLDKILIYRAIPRYDLGKFILDLGFNSEQLAYINKIKIDSYETIWDFNCYLRESVVLYLAKNEEIKILQIIEYSPQEFVRYTKETRNIRENIRLCLSVSGYYHTLESKEKTNILCFLGRDPKDLLKLLKNSQIYFCQKTTEQLIKIGYWKSADAVLKN